MQSAIFEHRINAAFRKRKKYFKKLTKLKPHSARTRTVFITYDCSRAWQSKRRCSLCDLSVD